MGLEDFWFYFIMLGVVGFFRVGGVGILLAVLFVMVLFGRWKGGWVVLEDWIFSLKFIVFVEICLLIVRVKFFSL